MCSSDLTQLPLETAKEIAKTQYWDALRLDEVALIAPRIAEELFDTAYNCGVDTAGRFLQESLNALNRQGRDYPDVVIDGRLGPATIASLRIYMMMRRKSAGEDVLLKALNALQGAYYIEIARTRPENETFLFGWLSKRVEL